MNEILERLRHILALLDMWENADTVNGAEYYATAKSEIQALISWIETVEKGM